MTALRPADPDEATKLVGLWHAAWHEAHDSLLPATLVALRTPEDFAARLPALLAGIRVAGPLGAPVGFCAVRDDELYQIFVDRAARGTGVGAALLSDGETRISAAGHRTAWLACAEGNLRAERFYLRAGWRCAGPAEGRLETAQNSIPMRVLRFEKALGPA